ncbi:pyrroloquinoline quinone precursor peptide PqqA [Streptomyces sp. NPDC001889]
MNTTTPAPQDTAPQHTTPWHTPGYEIVETALEVTAYALTD